jgi:hypothetical protein
MKQIELTRNELKEAITEGVRRAFWDMITNATGAPCADFFDSVKAGVKEAVEGMDFNQPNTKASRDEGGAKS